MKKVSFSCYVKCNTSHFNEKNIYFFKKKDFSVFFSFHFHVFNEYEGKSKKCINFSWQFKFFSQNCLIIPFPAFLWELTSYLRKNIFILVQKKGIYAISRKKILFTEKVNFLMIFCLFHCFHTKKKKKHWILPKYTFFSEKNNKWRVFQRF